MSNDNQIIQVSSPVYFTLIGLFSCILIFAIDSANYSLIFAGENFYYVLLGALEFPPRLFTPILDGYFFLSRFFTGLAAFISKENIASISLVFGAVFHAYCGTYILRNEYTWLISSFIVRLLLSILITFGPGMTEIIGNPVCVSYSASFLLILLMLKPEVLHSNVDKFTFAICAFSTNFLILLSPLVVIRWHVSKSRIFLYILSVIIIYTLLCLNLTRDVKMSFLRIDHTSLQNIDLLLFVKDIILNVITQILLINYKDNIFLALSVFLSAILCIFCILEKKKTALLHAELTLGLILCSLLFYFLHAVGRGYTVSHFSGRHGMMTITPILCAVSIFLNSNLKILISSNKVARIALCSLIALSCRCLFLSVESTTNFSYREWDNFLQCVTRYNENTSICQMESFRFSEKNKSRKTVECISVGEFNNCVGIDPFSLPISYRIPIND